MCGFKLVSCGFKLVLAGLQTGVSEVDLVDHSLQRREEKFDKIHLDSLNLLYNTKKHNLNALKAR